VAVNIKSPIFGSGAVYCNRTATRSSRLCSAHRYPEEVPAGALRQERYSKVRGKNISKAAPDIRASEKVRAGRAGLGYVSALWNRRQCMRVGPRLLSAIP